MFFLVPKFLNHNTVFMTNNVTITMHNIANTHTNVILHMNLINANLKCTLTTTSMYRCEGRSVWISDVCVGVPAFCGH